eukprot:COSAG01_NODE_16844_length_1199_cov_119.537273_1_plen_74_part_00
MVTGPVRGDTNGAAFIVGVTVSEADQALHTKYAGISAEQFAEWQSAFAERIKETSSCKLMSAAELEQIHDLLM